MVTQEMHTDNHMGQCLTHGKKTDTNCIIQDKLPKLSCFKGIVVQRHKSLTSPVINKTLGTFLRKEKKVFTLIFMQ